MKKRVIVVVSTAFLTLSALITTAFALEPITKPRITGFAAMAANIEKNYGTVLELDLSLRNGEPVYKTSIILEQKRVIVYFDAVTGKEIERREAVELDEEETEIFLNYDFLPLPSVETELQQEQKLQVAIQPRTNNSGSPEITYEKAKETALAKVGGGTVRDIELDYERGILIYEVEIKYNGIEYDVDIDASTGEIVKFKTEGSKSSPSNAAPVVMPSQSPQQSSNSSTVSSEVQITSEKAREIALAKVGGGTIKDIELDYERGVLLYEIEIKYNGIEYDVDINALTGEIVKYKIDD